HSAWPVCYPARLAPPLAGPTVRKSCTIIHPVAVCQVVSSTIVPGTYLRSCGTWALLGPNRNMPAPRSSSAPNTLGESGRGRHSHSTAPFGATRQLCSQLDKNPYSAMGGNVLSSPPVFRPPD